MTRTRRTESAVPATGLLPADLWREVVATIQARPARSLLTALGTVLGVGTLIAILGLTSTASGQVSARFDAQAATTVTMSDARDPSGADPFPLTGAGLQRALRLNGVTGAGLVYSPATDDLVHSAVPGHAEPTSLPIVAVSASAWGALGPQLAAGRTFDGFSEHLPVAVLGRAAASRLGITGHGPPTAIMIGDRAFLVAGVLDDLDRRPDLLLAVIVPAGTASDLWGEPSPKEEATVIIATRPGAALQVASEAPLAVSSLDPRAVGVTPPPDPRALRDSVSQDLAALFYTLAAICMLIGAVGIANTTLVAVMERSTEIGLRRALGADRRHIATQVMAESASLGILGGIVGAAVGLAGVVVMSLLRGWSPIVEPSLLLWAPLLGLGIGAVAGLYPALQATRIEPSQALRGR